MTIKSISNQASVVLLKNSYEPKGKTSILFLYFIIASFLCKLYIISNLDIVVNPSAWDDLFFVKSSLVNYWFFEKYTYLSLIKEPLWPLLMSFFRHVGIPLRIALEILLLAGTYFAVNLAISKEIKNSLEYKIILFTFIFWNPYTFPTFEKCTYDGVFGILFLMGVASVYNIGRHVDSNKFYKSIVIFSIISALLTITRRESSIVCLSSIIVILTVNLVNAQNFFNYAKRTFFSTAIFLCCLLVIQLPFRILNYHFYSFYSITEQDERKYLKAVALLAGINDDINNMHVPISLDALNRASQFSQNVRLLSNELHGSIGRYWSHCFVGHQHPDGEIGGGWIEPAIRESVDKIGYYKSSISAQLFYDNITSDLEKAFKEKKLTKRFILHNTIGGIPPLTEILKSSYFIIKTCFYFPSYEPSHDFPNPEWIHLFDAACTRKACSFQRSNNFSKIAGIAFNKDFPHPLDNVSFKSNKKILLGDIYYGKHNLLPGGGGMVSFEITIPTESSGKIVLTDTCKSYCEIEYINGSFQNQNPNKWIILSNDVSKGVSSNYNLPFILHHFKAYQIVWDSLLAMSIACILLINYHKITFNKSNIFLVLAPSAFIIARLLMMSIVDSTAFYMRDYRYIYPLIQGLTVLIIATPIQLMRKNKS